MRTGDVTAPLSRAQLLSRSAKGGVALLASGSIAGALSGSATADATPESDLAYARLLVGAELLAADFYAQAIAAKRFSGGTARDLKRALFNEHEHYESLSAVLSGAGQPAAVAGDLDFAYPKGSFASKASPSWASRWRRSSSARTSAPSTACRRTG
jgi:hypothetical protein